MAISNVALVGNQGLGHTSKVHFLNLLDLDLDNNYPAGGYAGIGASLKAAIGTDKTIIGFLQMTDGGGYNLKYDRANDKLKVLQGAAGAGPDEEVAGGTNLAAITNVEFLVWSK